MHAVAVPPACTLPTVEVPTEVSDLWLASPIGPAVAYKRKLVPLLPPGETGVCECP